MNSSPAASPARYALLYHNLCVEMKPIKSTIEILAFKSLGRPIDKLWVNWAVEMLMAGFETENLIILAGESSPYDQSELQVLTEKIFNELDINYSDKEKIINDFVCYTIDKALNKEVDSFKVLSILTDIYVELDYQTDYKDFYFLHYAKEELDEMGTQWYWEGADKSNIDQIVETTFIKWKATHQNNSA